MISRTVTRFRSNSTLRWRLRLAPGGAGHPATWLAWLVPIFAWAQLTYPGYFELHSGFLPIFNLNDLLRHLGDLAWAPTVGQPYDLLRGDGALPYRIAALLCLMRVSSVGAIKWVFGASILAGALGMYGWTRRQLGPWPALLAAAIYAFWPIGLATVYVRGAFAEAALLGLMPWVLWAADATQAPGRVWPPIALGLMLAFAIWTQTGLALWFAALVLIYILAQGFAAETARRLRLPLSADPAKGAGLFYAGLRGAPWPAWRSQGGLLGWGGGLILGVLGLLPAILARGMGDSSVVKFGDHFVYLYQLLLAGWGTGPSVPGPYDTLTFDLGVVACSLALFSILFVRSQRQDSQSDSLGSAFVAARTTQYVSAAIVLVLALLSTTLCVPIWRILSGLTRTLTYPWQLLLLAGPWLAWLAALGGQALWTILSAESARSPALSVGGLRAQAPGLPLRDQRERLALPVFAGLVVVALLGCYAFLNPQTLDLAESAGLRAPVGDAPLAIFGENEIALLSAEATGVPGPGGYVTISTRWQALRPLDRDYTVFVHAVTPDGTRWAQVDTMPQDGKFPTSQWRPGQVVTDHYQLRLPLDAPPGSAGYRYLLGLYEWQTGQRLPVGTDDKVVLTP